MSGERGYAKTKPIFVGITAKFGFVFCAETG
jgi:hypothetical protein